MMTKTKKDDGVQVRLSCVYAGDGWALNPGDVAMVDAAEAERLVGLGVAAIVAADPAPDVSGA
jgi:hypothetical protein